MTLPSRVFRLVRRNPMVLEIARRLAFIDPTRKVATVWTAKPYSMTGYERLYRLYELAAAFEREARLGVSSNAACETVPRLP